jgi:hypothetical protein
MWRSLKVGAALVAVVGLIMSSLAVAQAVDEPATADIERPEQVVSEALTPLIENGTLTQEQADAVVDQLAPLVARARFQDRTQELVKQLGRLAAETAEVVGITPDELGEQLEAGMTLAEIAEANGLTAEQLVRAVTDHIAAHLAVRVTAGKLDQARSDEIVATTEQTLSELIDVEHPFGTVLRERRNRALRGAGLGAAADVLGLSIGEIRAQLEEGNSLMQIAETQGVANDDLVDAILAPFAKQIEQAVERGRLTEDAAAEALEKAIERVGEAIQKVPGA